MKTIKTTLALLIMATVILVTAPPATLSASPLVVQSVVVPPQPARIAPMVLTASDAVTVIAQIKASNYTVSLNGAVVSVFPPSAMLITEGADVGKVRIMLMVRPSPSPTPTP